MDNVVVSEPVLSRLGTVFLEVSRVDFNDIVFQGGTVQLLFNTCFFNLFTVRTAGLVILLKGQFAIFLMSLMINQQGLNCVNPGDLIVF